MHFFFYGTLVAGSANPVAQAVHAKLRPLGAATARGRLYAIAEPEGWFPVLLRGAGTVHGVLYETSPGFGPADLSSMDDYENFDPARPQQSLYVREEIDIAVTGGERHSAQVYRFNQPLPNHAVAISGGDFRAWIDESGAVTFAAHRHQ